MLFAASALTLLPLPDSFSGGEHSNTQKGQPHGSSFHVGRCGEQVHVLQEKTAQMPMKGFAVREIVPSRPEQSTPYLNVAPPARVT